VVGLDAPCSSALYRIAQEAVGNALKHSRASSVVVRLRVVDEIAHLDIEDDGIGFDPDVVETHRPGMGLFSMRERAALVGGSLKVESIKGHGARVSASVPLKAAAPSTLESVAAAN
jgi:signal transduction histidine kinase